MQTGLSLHALTVRYGEKTALCGVNLTLRPGEIIGIVGPSGCGKSTLLRAVIGLLGPNAQMDGRIELDGVCLNARPPKKRNAMCGGRLGMVFQDPEAALCPVVRIRAQAYDVLRTQAPLSKKEADERMLAICAKLGLTDGPRLLQSYPFELSGGMQQRVSLALCMLRNPPVLLADEPTSALDAVSRLQVLASLRALREQFGTAILMTTHQMQALRLLADKIGVLCGGTLVEFGPAQQVLETPAHPVTKALLTAAARLRLRTEDTPCLF